MKARLLRIWSRLRTGYWLVPALLTAAALALAAALIGSDVGVPALGIAGAPRLDIAGPEGARALLSTIASSAITVAGLVFSITMVVLNAASAQFGPRLLRNFMAHNATQVVIGAFLGTFVYCLVTLAVVRSDAERVFVPQAAVAGGLLLGVVAFALLIYFIHHVSRFLQAAHVIDDVARGLEKALRSAFPERGGAGGSAPDDEAASDELKGAASSKSNHATICARHSGYVQAIDWSGLMEIASEADLVIGLDCRPGHFVIEGRPVAWAVLTSQIDGGLAKRIASAILTGPERTSTQDPEFAIHQLVEVALRALSPGINDPYTAINCIDRLVASLAVLASRGLPSRYVRDQQGRLRLVADPYSYGGMVEAAFNQIRQAAASNAAVLLRLLEGAETIARGDLPESYRDALRAQIEAIAEASRDQFPAQADRATLQERIRSARRAVALSSDALDSTSGHPSRSAA